MIYDGTKSPTIRFFRVISVKAGHQYTYRVQAVNRVGYSTLSPESAVIKAAKIPGKCQPPVYVGSTSTTISLRFSPVSDNGGSAVTAYKLYRDSGTLGSTFIAVSDYNGLSMDYLLDKTNHASLVTGTKYRFYFTASNSEGEGPKSDIV